MNYSIINSVIGIPLHQKINFCFIYHIFKFFNIFRKRASFNRQAVQSIFIVPIIKTLNFIHVTVLAVNYIFSVFILLRKKIAEFIKEVNFIPRRFYCWKYLSRISFCWVVDIVLKLLILLFKVWYSLWSYTGAKRSKILKQHMHIQNLFEPLFLITSASTAFKLLHFKWTMVSHNEHSIIFLHRTDLLQELQVSLTDITPDKLKRETKIKYKRRKEENVMTKFGKALLPLISW